MVNSNFYEYNKGLNLVLLYFPLFIFVPFIFKMSL